MTDALSSKTTAAFVLPSTANMPYSAHDMIFELYRTSGNDGVAITFYSPENSSGTAGTDTLDHITYISGVWFANEDDADQEPSVAVSSDEAPRDKCIITSGAADDGYILVVGRAVR